MFSLTSICTQIKYKGSILKRSINVCLYIAYVIIFVHTKYHNVILHTYSELNKYNLLTITKCKIQLHGISKNKLALTIEHFPSK